MIKEITIKKGWYYSAGRTYGWTGEHEPEGVGLNRDLFDADTIIVTVKGQKYKLDAKKGLEFIKRYKAHTTIGNNKIGFIPRTFMEKIEDENSL